MIFHPQWKQGPRAQRQRALFWLHSAWFGHCQHHCSLSILGEGERIRGCCYPPYSNTPTAFKPFGGREFRKKEVTQNFLRNRSGSPAGLQEVWGLSERNLTFLSLFGCKLPPAYCCWASPPPPFFSLSLVQLVLKGLYIDKIKVPHLSSKNL